jgi:FkbM family methyltransferase
MSDHDPSYWPKLVRLLRGIGEERPVFLDVGANRGDFTAMLLTEFAGCTVHAVEPDARMCEDLRKRFESAPVHVREVALGDRETVANFQVHANPATSSLLPRPAQARRYFHSEDSVAEVTPVRVTTLDRLAEEAGIGHVALAKLDTQGSELPILRGAERLLAAAAIDVFYTEFFVVPHYEGAALLHELWAAFARHGYVLHDLFKGPYGRNGQLRFGDAIFVSPRVRSRYLDAQPDEE